ncbi:hypothetical protein MOW07_06290 [Enterococcus hirae]|uniref:hypothetical protein n=1 Tax=Enterococcus hirae TaxID=1354 RepID=UPI00201A1FF2|nr:hypothetical protein [Enterococcus hirae]UQN40309.1 hypothetical protein MOW07_06290 [Enterococcus hirae]
MSKNIVSNFIIYLMLIAIIFQHSISYYLSVFNQIDNIFFVLICILGVLTIVTKKKINKNSLFLLGIMLIFYIIGIISYYLNSRRYGLPIFSYLGGFIYLKFYFIIFFFSQLTINISLVNKVLNSIVKIGIFSSFFMWLQLLLNNQYITIFPFVLPGDQIFRGIRGISGLFHHSAITGWFYFLVFTIILIRNVLNKSYNKFLLLYFFVMIGLTLKAKAIASVLIIIIFVSLIVGKRNKKSLLLGTFGITISSILLFKDLFLRQVQLYITGNSNVGDTTARYSLLSNSFFLAKEYYPLGVGFSKYGSLFAVQNYSEYYYYLGMNHIYGLSPEMSNFAMDTFWPAVLGETGYAGTVIYLILITFIFSIIFKKYRRTISYVNKNYNILFILSLAIMVGMLTDSVASPIFNTSPYIIINGMLVGLGFGGGINRKEILHT